MTPRSRFLLAYSAAWAPLAVLYSLLIYWQTPTPSLIGSIQGGIETVATAALLGLVVWKAIHRLAEQPRGLLRWIGAQVGLAICYSTVWNAMTVLSIWVFAPRSVIEMYVRNALGWSFVTGLILYGFLAGIAHAIAVSARLRREREASARSEALRARAELSALRAQMNPHFLFNTLHSISALVRSDPQAVEDALERLAGLLRRLLDSNRAGADHVSLSEEWDIVSDQLALERLRFGDRLNVVGALESEALECRIPMFTLQPLVENAIRHGVAAQAEHCTVRIAARVAGDVLTLEVRDDGPGADAKAVLAAKGLGVRSVRTRLLAQYGDSAGVHIETAPGAGFLVRVTLPAGVALPTNTGERRAALAGAAV